MVREIVSRVSLSLREKAALAWEQERPMREAARLEKRARQIAAVRAQLKRIFGADYEIRVGIDGNGKVMATVEDLRFTVSTYTPEIFSIYLVERCPQCDKELPIGVVSDLADVGQALEEFEAGNTHECNESC
jgi:hypothetical protein